MPSRLTLLFSPRILRPLFWFCAALALTMALLPSPPSLPIDRFGDKTEHMLAFATLALLADLGWRRKPTLLIAVGLSAFGALIEFLQAIPAVHRDADPLDWLADTAAIIVATLVARLLRRLLPEQD
ncbi:MAG: VanZ family protein [Proteobacteria bacterium]|nr:VanZ family protein [Pseudomonadota bacterium]